MVMHDTSLAMINNAVNHQVEDSKVLKILLTQSWWGYFCVYSW